MDSKKVFLPQKGKPTIFAVNLKIDIQMGKGDKKTKRGKITIGSYGNSRKHKVSAPAPVVEVKKQKSAKKTPAGKKA